MGEDEGGIRGQGQPQGGSSEPSTEADGTVLQPRGRGDSASPISPLIPASTPQDSPGLRSSDAHGPGLHMPGHFCLLVTLPAPSSGLPALSRASPWAQPPLPQHSACFSLGPLLWPAVVLSKASCPFCTYLRAPEGSASASHLAGGWGCGAVGVPNAQGSRSCR